MKQTIKDKITWIDILEPSDEEIRSLGGEFSLHPLIVEELRVPSARSKVEHHEHYLYLVCHFPVWSAELKTCRPVEVDFVLLKDHLITIRYEDSPPFKEYFTTCAQDPEECRRACSETPAHLLYLLFQRIFQFAERELAHISKEIERAEEGIFRRGREREMIHVIAEVKRDILDFRRIFRSMGSVLESLEVKLPRFYGDDVRIFAEDLRGDHARVANLTENYTDTIEALESTNNSLLSFKMNDVMRIFTIMAFLTFPLMVFLQALDISEFGGPIIQSRYGFWVLLGIIATITLSLMTIFRWKRWL